MNNTSGGFEYIPVLRLLSLKCSICSRCINPRWFCKPSIINCTVNAAQLMIQPHPPSGTTLTLVFWFSFSLQSFSLLIVSEMVCYVGLGISCLSACYTDLLNGATVSEIRVLITNA